MQQDSREESDRLIAAVVRCDRVGWVGYEVGVRSVGVGVGEALAKGSLSEG